jgi:hypothetical protein
MIIRFFKTERMAPRFGQNSPNYYWAFVGLIIVAGIVYAILCRLMPAKDFVADDVPAAA